MKRLAAHLCGLEAGDCDALCMQMRHYGRFITAAGFYSSVSDPMFGKPCG
jgi:hypothetical protein